MTFSAFGARTVRHLGRRRRPTFDWLHQLPVQFLVLYSVVILFYLRVLGSFISRSDSTSHFQQSATASRYARFSQDSFGHAHIPVSDATAREQRMLCHFRANARRTIVVHMHIPKSGGTAFAQALKSECRCRNIPIPRRGYCKECPHVLPDSDAPVEALRKNLWTFENRTFEPEYSRDCRTYKASSRWFGFQKKNQTYTFYSQNRLTSGWPCGVHVGYARLRMCFHRLQLRGVKHVIVTLFRDPLARFVSEFYQVAYNRREISSWDWCMKRIPPLSMREFFEMSVEYPFQSRMTKLLSGSPVQTGAAGEDWRGEGVRERALERALGVVESREDFLFGLAEELDLTLELFRFVFKREFEAPVKCHSHQNSSGERCGQVELGVHGLKGEKLELSEQDIRAFGERNREDKQVFEVAKRLFWERVEAMRSLKGLGSDWAIDRRCEVLLEREKNGNEDGENIKE